MLSVFRTLAADNKIDIKNIQPTGLPDIWKGDLLGSGGPIAKVLGLLIAAAGIVFIILLIVGGFMYLTGAGNEEQTGKAKKLMIDAIIGLILTLIAWAAGSWIYGELTKN